jgi:hypothetical protein
MKILALALTSLLFASAAMAQTPAPVAPVAAPTSCADQATAKSLHGAALNSFAKHCCTKAAEAQKLHGAAKHSNVMKCTTDSGAT